MSPGDTDVPLKHRRILVAEDDQNLRSLLRLSLGRVYDVETVEDGLAAVQSFETNPADMVILDIMMPNMDGLAACERIRRMSEVPVIMLTALGSADDIVKGFGLGADDYITKPFTFKELIARVEAVFRRLDWMLQPTPARVIVNGELRLNVDTHETWVNGQEVHLTPIEFQLLYYLVARPGEAISKEHLFREVWGYDLVGGTNLVEVGIRRLREKIEGEPSNPQIILTVRGTGYRCRVPVSLRSS